MLLMVNFLPSEALSNTKLNREKLNEKNINNKFNDIK